MFPLILNYSRLLITVCLSLLFSFFMAWYNFFSSGILHTIFLEGVDTIPPSTQAVSGSHALLGLIVNMVSKEIIILKRSNLWQDIQEHRLPTKFETKFSPCQSPGQRCKMDFGKFLFIDVKPFLIRFWFWKWNDWRVDLPTTLYFFTQGGR